MKRTGESRIRSAFLAGCIVLLAAASTAAQSVVTIDERLRESGFVDVVVLLDSPQLPAKTANAADTRRLEQSVASVQDRFLNSFRVSDGALLRRLRYSPVLRLRIRSDAELDALRSHPQVLEVGPDVGVRAATEPRLDVNVPAGGLPDPGPGVRAAGASPRLDGSVARISADQLHDLGIAGNGATIAIVDSGVDGNHPRLQGAVLAEACFVTQTDIDGKLGSVCPNGTTTQTGFGSAVDDNGHGTAVAGILASRGVQQSAGRIVQVGVAPESGLVALKVLNSEGRSGTLTDVAAALEWLAASDMHVDVVNLSISSDEGFEEVCDTASPSNRAMHAAVNMLTVRGTVAVAASGNGRLSHTIRSPACLSNVLAVAALTEDDRVASFSDGGPLIDIIAPGTGIRTTAPGGSFTTFGGTSASSPHVAGCAALLRSGSTGLAREQIESSLVEATAQFVEDTRNGLSYPSLDCRASYEMARTLEPDDTPPSGRSRAPVEVYPNPARGTVTISVTVSSSTTVSIRVFDTLGRSRLYRLAEATSGAASNVPLDVSMLPPGIYVVRVKGASIDHATTVVIQ